MSRSQTTFDFHHVSFWPWNNIDKGEMVVNYFFVDVCLSTVNFISALKVSPEFCSGLLTVLCTLCRLDDLCVGHRPGCARA